MNYLSARLNINDEWNTVPEAEQDKSWEADGAGKRPTRVQGVDPQKATILHSVCSVTLLAQQSLTNQHTTAELK